MFRSRNASMSPSLTAAAAAPAKLACLLAVAATFWHGILSRGDDRPALTLAQIKQVEAITANFRRAKGNPAQRLALIEQAARIGQQPARGLIEIVEKEMRPQLQTYQTRLHKAVEKAVVAKFNAANVQDITQHRGQVLALVNKEDLTKEEIEAKGDPALSRLKQLVLLDRETVLKQSPELMKQRQELAGPGAFWEKCQQAAFAVLRKSVAKEAQLSLAVPVSFDRLLSRQEELVIMAALPTDNATRAALAQNAKLAENLDAEEAQCVLELNLVRNLLGLPAVAIDPALCKAARGHSADMEQHKFFSHDSPLPGKASPWDRARLADTSASAENIAAGMSDGGEANQVWWHSPGHMKNMLGGHLRVGIGRSGSLWTEMFGD